MIYRKTVLDQPELNRSGLLQIRLALLLIEDDKEFFCGWHRTALELDTDAQQQMDFVNVQLVNMDPPQEPLAQEEIDFIKACHELQKSRFRGDA